MKTADLKIVRSAFTGETCPCTRFILAEILVLAGIASGMAPPASTRISARLKRVRNTLRGWPGGEDQWGRGEDQWGRSEDQWGRGEDQGGGEGHTASVSVSTGPGGNLYSPPASSTIFATIPVRKCK